MPSAITGASQAWSSDEQRRLQHEPERHEQRERDESGEPFERHRRERDLAAVGVDADARDADHVAADRRRQHVAHEQAHEHVPDEPPERDVAAVEAQHALPAPRLQHHAEQRHQQRQHEERDRARVVVARDDRAELLLGALDDEDGEEPEAEDDAEPQQQPGAPLRVRHRTEPMRQNPWRTCAPAGPCHSRRAIGPVTVRAKAPERSNDGTIGTAREHSMTDRRRQCGSRSTTASSSRSRSPVADPGSCSCTASAAPRRTSPTIATGSRADHTVVTFDHRGHGASDAPDRPRGLLVRSAACRHARRRRRRRARPLPRCSATRWAACSCGASPSTIPIASSALVMMDTSPGPIPGFDPELMEIAAGVALNEGKDALKALLDLATPLDTPALQARARTSVPVTRSSATASGTTCRPSCGARWPGPIAHQSDDLDAMRSLAMPVLVIVGDQDEPFLDAVARDGRRHRGRAARGDPRRRPLPAVREPRRLVRRARRLPLVARRTTAKRSRDDYSVISPGLCRGSGRGRRRLG